MRYCALILCVFLSAPLAWSKDVVVVTQDLMPIAGTGPDGKPAGAHVEVANRVCAKLQWNCKIEVLPLARAIKMMTDGEAHLLLGVAKNPEREAIAYFPSMVSQVGYTFFVKKGTAGQFTKVEDFKGKTVGVHGGSATHKDLVAQNEKLGKAISIVEETVPETSLRKLAAGRYGEGAAAYAIRPVGMLEVKKGNLAVEPVGFDGKIQSHAIALSKKSMTQADVDAYQKALAEVMKNAELKKYFAENTIEVHPDQK